MCALPPPPEQPADFEERLRRLAAQYRIPKVRALRMPASQPPDHIALVAVPRICLILQLAESALMPLGRWVAILPTKQAQAQEGLPTLPHLSFCCCLT